MSIFKDSWCMMPNYNIHFLPFTTHTSKDSTMKILIRTDLRTLVTHSSLYFWVATTGTLNLLRREKKKKQNLKAVKELQRIKKKKFWIKGKLIRDRKRIRQAGRSQQQTVRCDTIKTGSLSWDSPRT